MYGVAIGEYGSVSRYAALDYHRSVVGVPFIQVCERGITV